MESSIRIKNESLCYNTYSYGNVGDDTQYRLISSSYSMPILLFFLSPTSITVIRYNQPFLVSDIRVSDTKTQRKTHGLSFRLIHCTAY